MSVRCTTECLPVKGFKGDKLARLRGVGLYEHKKVVWNKYRKWTILEEELLNFGHSAHDDAVDSMVLTMGGLLRRGSLQLEYNSDSFDFIIFTMSARSDAKSIAERNRLARERRANDPEQLAALMGKS